MRKLRVKQIGFSFVLFIGKLILLSLTFVIGVASPILLSEVSPPTVTLCQLAQTPYLYDGRTVRVIADGIGGGFSRSILIEDGTCNSPDAWSGVSVVENTELAAETEKFLTESDSAFFKARVLVTGRFDPNNSMGCFGPKFGIDATNIELLSEITAEPLPKRLHE